MGASIRCGIQALIESDAWLIACADMPLIKQSTVATILTKIRSGSQLVAPEYNGKLGHPVGFGKTNQEELLNLPNEHGAKSILENHADLLHIIKVDDHGITADVDNKNDLHYINKFLLPRSR